MLKLAYGESGPSPQQCTLPYNCWSGLTGSGFSTHHAALTLHLVTSTFLFHWRSPPKVFLAPEQDGSWGAVVGENIEPWLLLRQVVQHWCKCQSLWWSPYLLVYCPGFSWLLLTPKLLI